MSRNHHCLRKYTRINHAWSGPRISPSVSHVRKQRIRHEEDILQGELEKIKPQTFNGENMKGEYVESWLLQMKKYFHPHDFLSRVEARIAS